MSMALIREVHDEVRKLLIAGSEMAIDNYKLKKILPGMKKSGESVPVFARVADAMEAAVLSESAKSQDSLLELANIINAIIYTQGETGIQGDMEEVDSAGLTFPTDIPFRRINPIIIALTTKGSGRLETIRQFYTEGNFKDLRLIIPLINALGDSYPDIGDLAFRILKDYGEKITPVLKKNLDFNGSRKDARIIELITDLKGKNEKDFYLDAVEKGSLNVKASAVKSLKYFPECEDMLIELSKDRNKEVREAAFYALEKIKTGNAVKRLFEGFKGKDRHIASTPIKNSNSEEIAEGLLAEAENTLELIKGPGSNPKKSDPPAKEGVEYFCDCLDCMYGKKSKRVLAFLKTCADLSHKLPKLKLNNADTRVIQLAARNILAFETEEAFDFLVSAPGKYDNSIISYSFKAALKSKSPEYIFKNYSPLLKKGNKSFEYKEIIGVLNHVSDFEEAYRIPGYYSEPHEKYNIKWDRRWSKLLIGMGELSLGCKVITRGDMGSVALLLEKLKNYMKFGSGFNDYIIQALFQAGYENVRDEILNVLEFNFKNGVRYMDFYINSFAEVIKLLPSSDARYIEDFVEKYRDNGGDKLMDVVWYLKNKTAQRLL